MKFDAYVNVRIPSTIYAAAQAEARRQGVRLSHIIRDAVRKEVGNRSVEQERPQ